LTQQNSSELIVFILVGFILIGLLFGFIIYFVISYRHKQRDFLLLENQKQEIEHKNEIIKSTIADLKATQSQLIQSEKLASLGELTAGIAHEIQNPLNFVNNFSEISIELMNELVTEIDAPNIDIAAVKDIANDLSQNQSKINFHGKRASNIVMSMLEHSRQSNGLKTETDINQLADEYLRLSYHGLRAKDKTFNADFATELDPNLPKVKVVQQDIGRVILNLINNAFQSRPQSIGNESKPTLKVTVKTKLITDEKSPTNSWATISISDNGAGMTEATKSKIFQPFFTTKPTGQGTGLGLSLAYDIISKGHAGTIECNSKLGEGTEFIVKLLIK
jgi:two-component system, NtrC family, sensor kinase